MKKLAMLSLAVVTVLALTGCDTTTANAPGNTTLGGAAVGSLAGAGIGALAGGNTKSAAIGAAVGGLGGAVVGNQMERNRTQSQYAQQNAYNQGYQDGRGGPAPAPRSY